MIVFHDEVFHFFSQKKKVFYFIVLNEIAELIYAYSSLILP
jgi:hypothetical protein